MSIKKVIGYSFGVTVLLAGSVVLGAVTAPVPTQQQSAKQQTPAVAGVSSDESTTGGVNAIPLSVTPENSLQATQTTAAPRQYAASLGDVTANVTVQQAPDNFRSNPGAALATLAVQMNATQAVQTKRWGKCYITTANGSQAGFCANSLTFVVVQSPNKQPLAVWGPFLESVKE